MKYDARGFWPRRNAFLQLNTMYISMQYAEVRKIWINAGYHSQLTFKLEEIMKMACEDQPEYSGTLAKRK